MSAKNRKFSAARAACPRAWVTGSPVSNVSMAAICSPRASMASAIRFSTRARARAVIAGQGPVSNAAVAASTARSTSSGPPAATCAYTRLVTGSATSNVAPSTLEVLPADIVQDLFRKHGVAHRYSPERTRPSANRPTGPSSTGSPCRSSSRTFA